MGTVWLFFKKTFIYVQLKIKSHKGLGQHEDEGRPGAIVTGRAAASQMGALSRIVNCAPPSNIMEVKKKNYYKGQNITFDKI